jgi:tetratricopeptide (TPR) repeat protein
VSSDQANRDSRQDAHARRGADAAHDDLTLVRGSPAGGVERDQLVTDNSLQRLEDDQTLVLQPATWRAASDQVVVGNIPQRSPGFQPRPYLLGQLNRVGRGSSVLQVVTGRRGVGKTQLVAAYAQAKLAEGWRLVAWVNASDTGSLLAGLAAVADAAGLRGGGSARDTAQAGRMVRNLLQADGDRCLLVFDGAEDPDVLRPFLPVSGAAQALITSTGQSLENLGTSVSVNVFSAEEALSLLNERTGLTDEEGAAVVAAELGHLPLALAQAAAVIAGRHLGYRAYLEGLRTLPVREYLMRQGGPSYPHGVAEAVLLSLDAVRAGEHGDVCTGLMEIMAVLSGGGVRRELLYAAGRAGVLARRRRRSRVTAELVDWALGRLAERSLLNVSLDGQTVIAHRLVMQVIRDGLARQMRLTAVYRAAASLLDTRAAALASSQAHAAIRDIIEQVRTLRQNAVGPALETDGGLARMVLSLRFWALYHLNKLGDSASQAIAVGEPLVSDFERLLGPDHPDTLTARDSLATAYQAAGRAAEAIPLYERTLAACERLLGADHPRTLNSRGSLAAAYRNAGRVSEAIPLLERTVVGQEKVLGPDHPNTLTAQGNLANAYRNVGRTAEAIPLVGKILADQERMLGPDHPNTLTTLNNLAAAYREAGGVAEAIPLFEHTLASRERLLGTDHPGTLTTRHNLANAYRDAGRAAEAIPLFEQALATCERLRGPDHPRTLSSQNGLAAAYRDAGRAAEAIPLLERTLAAQERLLGADHPNTVSTREYLNLAHQEAGRAQKGSQAPPHDPVQGVLDDDGDIDGEGAADPDPNPEPEGDAGGDFDGLGQRVGECDGSVRTVGDADGTYRGT